MFELEHLQAGGWDGVTNSGLDPWVSSDLRLHKVVGSPLTTVEGHSLWGPLPSQLQTLRDLWLGRYSKDVLLW